MENKKVKIELLKITEKVKRLIFDIPKSELSKILTINPKTLDKRLTDNDWKHSEVLIINDLIEKRK